MQVVCEDVSEKVTPDPKFSRADTSTSMDTASTDESVVQNLLAKLDDASLETELDSQAG